MEEVKENDSVSREEWLEKYTWCGDRIVKLHYMGRNWVYSETVSTESS